MRVIRQIGSLAFVVGLFVVIFIGIPWHVIYVEDPAVPFWLQIAVFCLLGGIFVVMLTVAFEQRTNRSEAELPSAELEGKILLLNSAEIPGREISEILGLVQGHTVFAIWLGKDLSALVRLVLGGELLNIQR